MEVFFALWVKNGTKNEKWIPVHQSMTLDSIQWVGREESHEIQKSLLPDLCLAWVEFSE